MKQGLKHSRGERLDAGCSASFLWAGLGLGVQRVNCQTLTPPHPPHTPHTHIFCPNNETMDGYNTNVFMQEHVGTVYVCSLNKRWKI